MSQSRCAIRRMCLLGVVTAFSVGCAVISHQTQEEGNAEPAETRETAAPEVEAADTMTPAVLPLGPDGRERVEIYPGVILTADRIRKDRFEGNVVVTIDQARPGNESWPMKLQAQQAEFLKTGPLKLTGQWTIVNTPSNWTSSWGPDSVAYVRPDGQISVEGKARTVTPSVSREQ